MKKGDIVICNRLDYINGCGELSYLPFHIGKRYYIDSIFHHRLSNEITCIYITGDSGGKFAFSYYLDPVYLRKFSDYFISLEDYRDNIIYQIIYSENVN